MKLSNHLKASGNQLKDLADATDLQDAVTLAQQGKLAPLIALNVIELRVISQLLAELPRALEWRPGQYVPPDLEALRKALARST